MDNAPSYWRVCLEDSNGTMYWRSNYETQEDAQQLVLTLMTGATLADVRIILDCIRGKDV